MCYLLQNNEDPHRRFGLAEVKTKMITTPPSKLRSLFSGIGIGNFDDEISDITESEGTSHCLHHVRKSQVELYICL